MNQNNSSRISSEDYLEDAKYLIKKYYGIAIFAELTHVSRNTLSRVLNGKTELTAYWINLFAEELGMDLRDYIVFRNR